MEIDNRKNTQCLQEFDITIPCWNSERTLTACLRGLQKSDIPIRKIYVIDQCSTDGTIEIAKSFGTEIVFHSGKYTDAILLCAKTAETEYSLIIDSDVIISPSFFADLSPYYQKNLMTKGIVVNYLPKKYNKIVQRDIDYFSLLKRCNGFAAIIIRRKEFISVFEAIVAPWNGIDASSDSLFHIYCAENDIPCHQSVNVRSIHLVMNLQRLWRSRRWYAQTTKNVPIRGLTFSSHIHSPTILWNLIKYRDLNLFLHDIVCYIYWFWGLII